MSGTRRSERSPTSTSRTPHGREAIRGRMEPRGDPSAGREIQIGPRVPQRPPQEPPPPDLRPPALFHCPPKVFCAVGRPRISKPASRTRGMDQKLPQFREGPGDNLPAGAAVAAAVPEVPEGAPKLKAMSRERGTKPEQRAAPATRRSVRSSFPSGRET